MRANELAAVEGRLEAFLGELTGFLGRRDRRAWASAYVRGLLLDGERKSAEPMATRLGKSKQGLQQFVSQSPWPAATLLEGLVRREARRAAPDYWIIDETSFPKAGKHSVGVARQYCGALGKIANCQVAVSLHRAGERPAEGRPLSWRLYLPEAWTADVARRAAAGVPAEVAYQSKTDLALAVLDEALGWGAYPGLVLADEAYGGSFEWRAALRQRGLRYAVRVPWTTTGWKDAPLFEPQKLTAKGRSARRPRPLGPGPQDVRQIARALPADAWTAVTWRQGSKGPQTNRFARLPLWAANGWRTGPQPARIEEALLIEWPTDAPEPTRYWLAQTASNLPLPTLVAAAKARWRIEQDYRELKEELGLDHFEGRSWAGWGHHLALATVAFAFLRAEQRRRTLGAQKKAAANPARDAPAPPGRAHPLERPMSLVPNPL